MELLLCSLELIKVDFYSMTRHSRSVNATTGTRQLKMDFQFEFLLTVRSFFDLKTVLKHDEIFTKIIQMNHAK